jgi:starvation-inducible DNA-binding protein
MTTPTKSAPAAKTAANLNDNHHKINIGLSDKQREQTIDILNKALADQYIVYLKTQKYHWNVTGPEFYQFHIFLETQYTALAEDVDEIAERVRQVGGKAIGTMSEFLKTTRLAEDPGKYPSARDMLHELLHDHEAIIRQLREDIDKLSDEIGDQTTADFLTEQAEHHEKMAWMLGATIGHDYSEYRKE